MSKAKIMTWLACAWVLAMLAACGGGQKTAATTAAPEANSAASTITDAAAVATAAPAAGAAKVTATLAAAPAAAGSKATVAVEQHAVDNAEVIRIVLNGKSITVAGDGIATGAVVIDGSKVTITRAGAYSLSGTLADGQIVVDTEDKAAVLLVLDGVDIHSATSAPIYIADAKDAVLILADGATNAVSDENAYVLEAESDEPNAAIFSKADLTIEGNGVLTVEANYNDGIASKDSLTITGGVLTVDAVDDGLRGKDYLLVTGGDLTVRAGGDGLKSDIEDDVTLGYVTIEAGVLNVTAGGDAISGQTNVTVAGGELKLTSGGGSQGRIDETISAKGIKGVARVDITGGTFTIDSADDAIHSNNSIVIQGGAFDIATGDDAVHADTTVEINGGDFRITECYEEGWTKHKQWLANGTKHKRAVGGARERAAAAHRGRMRWVGRRQSCAGGKRRFCGAKGGRWRARRMSQRPTGRGVRGLGVGRAGRSGAGSGGHFGLARQCLLVVADAL